MPIRGEVVLPLRVVPQPTPSVNANGDCGACVLAGLLRITPAEVYPLCEIDPVTVNLGYERMRRALLDGRYRGDFDRLVTECPEWPQDIQSMRTYGNSSRCQAMEWFGYVRLGFDAGYYAIANVDHSRQGDAPNHWALLVGAREVWPDGDKGGAIHQQVLVSCSARSTPDEEWVEVRDFLQQRGGFNVYLVRPTK
jgi:hypothetical protein